MAKTPLSETGTPNRDEDLPTLFDVTSFTALKRAYNEVEKCIAVKEPSVSELARKAHRLHQIATIFRSEVRDLRKVQ